MLASTIILGRALAPFESLLANWNNLVGARAAYARLKPHLEQKLLPPEVRLPAPEGRVSVERVTLAGATADRPIIRGVAFELAAGDSLAIIGPSASGKSSLARLIIGIWTPTTGAVRLDGAEIAKLDRDHIGPYLGYLPQDVELFPGTVAENIARLGELDCACHRVTRPRSAEAAIRSPEARCSVSASHGRSTDSRSWWCSTSPTPTSTPRARRACSR
jgi:ABC-type protease/lipase transport system fused ATPase/permease subunit